MHQANRQPTLVFKLHCNGVKLSNKDGFFGKSDPFVVIRNSKGIPVGFSEVIDNNLNPFWRPIELDVDACGGLQNDVRVEVVDFDDNGDHDLIGALTIKLSELTSHLNKEWKLTDRANKKTGRFVVSRVEQEHRRLPPGYLITFAAEKLPRMDGIVGKSDPFLMIYAAPPQEDPHVIQKPNR